MDLSIIIVNWNSKDYLRKCLASVFAETQGLEFEVIVIDSASYDGCDQMLRDHYPQVRFIQSDQNVGFARANNEAFKAATGECVLFLNPDTEIVGPAIKKLYESYRNLPDAGIVAPRILNEDRSFQISCVQIIPTIWNRMLDSEFTRRRYLATQWWGGDELSMENCPAVEVEAVSGACILIGRECFLGIGGFSEDYFMYGEDVDLSCKVRQHGRKIYHIPEAIIIHFGEGSSRHSPDAFSAVVTRESVWLFFRKFRGAGYAAIYRGSMAGCAVLRVCILIAVSPCAWLLRKRRWWNCAVHKWVAVLKWALRIAPIAKRHVE